MLKLLLETSTKADGNLSYDWGSDEEVTSNLQAFLSRFGRTLQKCVTMQVEHEDRITEVTSVHKGETIHTEALVTSEPGVILLLLTADCFPVALHDPRRQVIALAHLGWKPTGKQLAAKVVREFKEKYGSESQDIRVMIGPGIRKESYRFENPLQRQFPERSKFLTDLPSGETQVDVLGYIQQQLLESEISASNISVSPIDTAVSSEYFSHYRSVRTGEPEGRFATIAGLF